MIKEVGIKRFADDTTDMAWINDAMRVGHLTDRQIPDVGDVDYPTVVASVGNEPASPG